MPRGVRKEELAKVARFTRAVQDRMRELRSPRVFVPFNSIGPYDHNPEDYPLPDASYPEVFRALYDAVEWVTNSRWARGLGPDARIKIAMIESPETNELGQLNSQIVWRSWRDGDQRRGGDPQSGDLHERIADALGWSVDETRSFSLQALRDMVRGTGNTKLVREIEERIRSGAVVRGAPRRSTRRRDPQRRSTRPTAAQREFVSEKIRTLRREGFEQDQAVAMALRMAGVPPRPSDVRRRERR